jgi:hypothetical protein
MGALAAAPREAVPFFKDHLRPVPAVDEGQLARWIADLDRDEFARREAAATELAKLGGSAETALRRALAGEPSLEVRRRLERLLANLRQNSLAPDTLRVVRAVEVLEHLATPGARQLLTTLAEGAPDARETQEAQASLERLTRRAR